jgi:hypothetical protein
MSCESPGTIECDTVQIIEPRDDLLVDTAGTRSDMDERGSLELSTGQTAATIAFVVPKLNANYTFEYLYVECMGNPFAAQITAIPTVRATEGFAVLFVGLPIVVPAGSAPYTLHWRVVINRTSSLVQIDAPEDLYLQIPQNANVMAIPFVNPRSGTGYGFSELRVENLHDNISTQALIHVQIYLKTTFGCAIGLSPRVRTQYYFLKVRTP